MEKIAVVILNYKVKDTTLKCVSSILKSTYKNLQIIVVDNNSMDGIENELPKENNIVFIQTGENLGYSGGNNIGIKKALEMKSEYILVLNPDTEIDKNATKNLLIKAKKYNAAIVCPKIYFSNSKIIWFAGKEFDSMNVLGKHRGVDLKDLGQFDEDNVTVATGAAMMVRRDVFLKIGFFDEKYFLYLEDSDFSLRAQKAGFKIMYVHDAIVYHENAKSTGLGSFLQDYYITRNRMYYASKYLPFRTRFALFKEAIRNFNKKPRRQAFIDFLFGKMGKGKY